MSKPKSWPQTESSAIQFLLELRWPEGPTCPYCGQHDPARMSTTGGRDAHECLECLRQFRWTHDTVFYKSPLPNKLWCDTIWEIANDWEMNSLELSRRVPMGNHTSWRLMRKIKAAAQVGGWSWQPTTDLQRAQSLAACVARANRKKVLELVAKWDKERPKRKSPTKGE